MIVTKIDHHHDHLRHIDTLFYDSMQVWHFAQHCTSNMLCYTRRNAQYYASYIPCFIILINLTFIDRYPAFVGSVLYWHTRVVRDGYHSLVTGRIAEFLAMYKVSRVQNIFSGSDPPWFEFKQVKWAQIFISIWRLGWIGYISLLARDKSLRMDLSAGLWTLQRLRPVCRALPVLAPFLIALASID